MIRTFLLLLATALLMAFPILTSAGQSAEPLRPEWCRELPRPEYKALKRVDLDNDWFEVYSIRDGVFAIYEPHQFEEVISYLIVGKSHALLFDTGMGIGKISNIVKQLTNLPVIILNSHTHFDHVGGNSEFPDIFGRDTAFTANNSKGQANNYSRDALVPERICGHLPVGVKSTTYTVRPFHIQHFVSDNEHIELGGRNLTVIFTPGHTPDSLSLYDQANGLLFTGDTFYRGPIYLITPETDFAAYAKSVDRLAALTRDVKLVLPGHNVPFAEPFYLERLQSAVHSIQRGKLQATMSEGHREFKFEGFSILLAPK